MKSHPIVNGVPLTDEQERRIRQIDALLSRALFLDREDAELAAELTRQPRVFSVTKYGGDLSLLFGGNDSTTRFVGRNNAPRPAPKPAHRPREYWDDL